MKKPRYSEEQIVRILREAGRDPVARSGKRHGVSEQSIYGWRKRFGDFGMDEVRRLKDVEAKNARLRNPARGCVTSRARRAETRQWWRG